MKKIDNYGKLKMLPCIEINIEIMMFKKISKKSYKTMLKIIKDFNQLLIN
jgi:hypothetical protein